METYFVPLKKVAEDFDLEVLFAADDFETKKVTRSDVNRPGLQLAGYFEHFDSERLQVIGKVEVSYLGEILPHHRTEKFGRLFTAKIPALIITRELEIFDEIIECAKEYNVSVMRTEEPSSTFIAALIAYLNNALAMRITRHGVLVEVYGEGILLLGESGVGKSETAMELLKRGHRLIADDAVEIKKVSNITLVGSSPDIIKYMIELRGVGIVDVRRIFGMGAVKETEKINFVMELEDWDDNKQYDRLGLEEKYMEILGIKIPRIEIPVKPGRNLAIIIEVAAMNARQKRFGYNAASELNRRIEEQYK